MNKPTLQSIRNSVVGHWRESVGLTTRAPEAREIEAYWEKRHRFSVTFFFYKSRRASGSVLCVNPVHPAGLVLYSRIKRTKLDANANLSLLERRRASPKRGKPSFGRRIQEKYSRDPGTGSWPGIAARSVFRRFSSSILNWIELWGVGDVNGA